MKAERIYWDSDTILAWFQKDKGKYESCKSTLQRAQHDDVIIFTSTLTIAEVLWMRSQPKIPEEKATILQNFFRSSYIRVVDVTRNIAHSAQDLVWDNNIRPKDAIHVATAISANVKILETFDKRLIKKSGKIGKPTLLIRAPVALN